MHLSFFFLFWGFAHWPLPGVTQQWLPCRLSGCCWQTWQREGEVQQSDSTHLDRYLWWPAGEQVKVTETRPHLRWDDGTEQDNSRIAGWVKNTKRGGNMKTEKLRIDVTENKMRMWKSQRRWRCENVRKERVVLLLLSSLVMYGQLLGAAALLPAARRQCQCHKINVGHNDRR